MNYIYIRVTSNYFFEFNYGDVIWAWLDCLGVCSRKPALYITVVSEKSHLDPSCAVKSSQLSSGTSGSGGWYPEIGERSKKVLSNTPKKGSIEPSKKGSIEPQKESSMEPQWKGFQNHREVLSVVSNLSHRPPPPPQFQVTILELSC